jgi:hypothetical protein
MQWPIPPVPPVAFVYQTWVGMFPEFGSVNDELAQGYFLRASMICANSTINPLFCYGTLQTVLYLLTAHIAKLNAPVDDNGNPTTVGQPNPSIVGRINSATQGSVSVQAEWGNGSSSSPTEAWYLQTKYGAEAWTGMAPVRTFRYAARPTRVPSGAYPGGGVVFGRFGR